MSHLPRAIARRVSTPPPEPGFAGPGHTAVEVLTPRAPMETDPFVLLMDDRLDFTPGRQVGGAHPHAGLETVTLVLEGSLFDRDEGLLSQGEVVWMTAGRGIVHNESVEGRGPVRVLQAWIALRPEQRDSAPGFQVLRATEVPVRREPGVVARLYSGTTGELTSTTRNLVPTTLVEFELAANAGVLQLLPQHYSGFLYVVAGSVRVDDVTLETGDVGHLASPGGSHLELHAGPEGGRVVLYAGEPIGAPIVQYGPFVAGSLPEIQHLYSRYRNEGFTRLSSLEPS
ncbi:MAG TPA: pirin-like C-terminal cupin domain-containing protein [Polyangiaceae bacterium]|nr:pirin-like C-terminal cupin domain-containing protein [Polyangiaceae bacterium]